MTNNLSFIFLYGIDFLSGVLVLTLCRAKGLVFFVERTDENRRSFKNDKKIWDRIGILNEVMFDYFIVHRADCLFVVSEYLENKYKAKFPELNVKRSVPSFINIDQFKHESNNNINDLGDIDVTSFQLSVPVIMFAGSCIYTNGLEFFLMNAEQVYKSGFDFRIVLLFFKGDVDYIRFQICKYKLDEICMIYENINPQYIPAFYQKADILVIPEMGDVVANAGFPGKTAECLAAGKAIISTNFSNLKDILINDENCLISDLGDSETYQINLKRLIQDTNLRERLGAHAIQTAIEFFDYKKSVTPMVNELKLHQAI